MSDEEDKMDIINKRIDEIDLKYAELLKATNAQAQAIEDIKTWIRDKLVPELNGYAKVINTVSEMIKKAQGNTAEEGEQPKEQMNVEVENARRIQAARQDLLAGGGNPDSPFMKILFDIAGNVANKMFAPPASNAQIFTNTILPEMESKMMEQYIEGMKINNSLGSAIIDAIKKRGMKALGENAAGSVFEGILED